MCPLLSIVPLLTSWWRWEEISVRLLSLPPTYVCPYGRRCAEFVKTQRFTRSILTHTRIGRLLYRKKKKIT